MKARKVKSWFAGLFVKVRCIRLADRFLLAYMIILMIQSIHNLFFDELAGGEVSTIDAIIRTTAAAIFGYLIGVGFVREDPAEPADKGDPAKSQLRNIEPGSSNENSPTARIGYTMGQSKEEAADGKGDAFFFRKKPVVRRIRQQMIIVGTIGMVSLIILVVANNSIDSFPSSSFATVSQLRDFVSGSVGLLIGHSASEKTT